MSNATRIADLLRDYARAKKQMQSVRIKLVELAVEELGLDQSDAKGMNIETFLDGYCVGKGMRQSWRTAGDA